MNVQAILSRLERVRRSGGQWIARCPAHDDKTPSLSVHEENGRVLLHCFAGCTVESICVSLRIKTADLFSEPRTLRRPEPAIVQVAERGLGDVRSRLTARDREREVTVIFADRTNVDPAIARGLALAVEGEIVQLAFKESGA